MKGNIQVCFCRECNWRVQRQCSKKAAGFLTLKILLHYSVILPTRSVSNVALTLECNWIYSGYTLYKVCITIPGHSNQDSAFYNTICNVHRGTEALRASDKIVFSCVYDLRSGDKKDLTQSLLSKFFIYLIYFDSCMKPSENTFSAKKEVFFHVWNWVE